MASKLFIFVTLFLILTLAWSALSSPAPTLEDDSTSAILKQPVADTEVYNIKRILKFGDCKYCGGYSASDCSRLCYYYASQDQTRDSIYLVPKTENRARERCGQRQPQYESGGSLSSH
ncbi:hypothetical protein Glove_433g11 [Diversispora epigaea]|uniref:Uncharacterized protein n=1 Tax=Diversispora epigaea TaxID=1348612 RepID=A0A397GXV3_9GLOM|nr:hypothetical protein Glove_433g11 [Diversispora epigaea]